jgi:tetrathionate reductase subunit B
MAISDTARTPSPAAGTGGVRWRMALDVDRCIGCHACSVACKVENKVPPGRFRTKVYCWGTGRFPKTKRYFLPTLCMPCEDVPCLKSRPEDAIFRSADGIVKINPDRCTHERKCEAACLDEPSAMLTRWTRRAETV